MTLWWLRALERIHGHLGFLTVAALFHPAILLWRRPTRRVRLAAAIATGLTTVTAAMGMWLYPTYRVELKQDIFIHAPAVGWMFERKEHLAAGALALAWVGLATHLASQRATGETRERLGRTAWAAYLAAAAMAAFVAAVGVWVASFRSF